MNAYILVLFFAMTPVGGSEADTQFTKMFVEHDSRISCEQALDDITGFKMVTPVGTFELDADCFPAAPESGTQEYNEDLFNRDENEDESDEKVSI